jgi:2-oxoisovalerate dehydrogenase E1 component alpha subunit
MRWLVNENQWNEQQHQDYKKSVKEEGVIPECIPDVEPNSVVLAALKTAEKEKKPPISDLFNDVYDTLPPHLQEQKKELERHFAKYGDKYKLDVFAEENQNANRS